MKWRVNLQAPQTASTSKLDPPGYNQQIGALVSKGKINTHTFEPTTATTEEKRKRRREKERKKERRRKLRKNVSLKN